MMVKQISFSFSWAFGLGYSDFSLTITALDLINAIYNSILHVSLFYEVEITQQLKCAINNWALFVEKTKTSSFVVSVSLLR